MTDAPIPISRARSARRRDAVDLVIHNIGTLTTPAEAAAPLRGKAMNEPIVTKGAAIAIKNGMIVAAGRELGVRSEVELDGQTELLDARGQLAIPGFVDCHAHPIFAGDRAHEFELRNTGVDYETIHAQGGGIQSTVKVTTLIPDDELGNHVERHLDWMLRSGTTTAEAKSGYGLGIDEELRMLRIGRKVAEVHPVDVSFTGLMAHTVPAKFDGTSSDFIDQIAIPALTTAQDDGLVTQADIFVERGSFTAEDAQRYLEHAASLDLGLRMHVDQFSEQGGLEVAVALGARSVDHLEATGADGVSRLAASSVAAVMLPTSSLMLGRPYAPGRALVDAGAVVAIASDFNPGSSFGESMPMAMSLATMGCGLSTNEAFSAATVNAAWVLGLHEVAGRISRGYRADIVLCDQPDIRHLAYHVGSPMIEGVIKGGFPLIGIDAPPPVDPEPPRVGP